MKMTDTLQPTFFLKSSTFPLPPRGGSSGEVVRATSRIGRYDIHDAEGYAPEIICRTLLGLSFAFAFVQCFLQIAAK